MHRTVPSKPARMNCMCPSINDSPFSSSTDSPLVMHALRAHRQISENCHVQMGNYNAIRLAVDHFVVLSLRFCVGGFHFSSQSQSGKNSKFLPWVSGNLTASSIANICRLLLVGVVNNTTIILHSDGKHPHCWRNLGVSYRVGRYA